MGDNFPSHGKNSIGNDPLGTMTSSCCATRLLRVSGLRGCGRGSAGLGEFEGKTRFGGLLGCCGRILRVAT